MVVNYVIVHAAIPVPFGVRLEVTADNTSVRVSWGWLCQGVVDLVKVHYQPEEGSLMMYTVDNTTEITSVILPNLHCNTKYTIWVHASGGPHNSRSLPKMVNLPAEGMFMWYNLLYSYCSCSTVSSQLLPLPPMSLLRS